MALARYGTSRKRLLLALVAILLAVSLGFAPLADCRPVPSGWDVTSSEGSSDSTLWRAFSTKNQASSYHRLLRELEGVKKVPEETLPEEPKVTETYAEDGFTTMDYANPRSNASGSSDDLTPPLP
ncbi:hypothetical protein R1flu_007166 [Riccia fluitans]|uniref:Uncharacterized protein n=1 Tax=Riccia fluitans TaxID=41844 RepID=A0ABD1YY30_9MARC